jgi:Rieske Fe-S protein
MERPKAGDLLVYSWGEHEGAVIKPADLQVGGPPAVAWAFDPEKKVPRDGSRLNQVLLVRVDPAKLTQDAQARAADGVIAFSAICTHAQCTVTGWVEAKHIFQCPCHQSEYDPMQAAKVVGGPAPRPLPALPLKIADGALQVAGPFIGHVGVLKQPGTG